MKLSAIFKSTMIAAASTITMPLVSSCEKGIYEDTDCVESYNLIKLTYTYNMKFADAFDHEVDQVTMFVFDSNTSMLVQRLDLDQNQLTADNEVELKVEPGSYDILVWGGKYSSGFDIPQGEIGKSMLADFDCRIRLADSDIVDEELPALFHALKHFELPYASPSKPNREVIDLMKDTNEIRVVLQQLSGEPVYADNFEFKITDDNAWLNYDNSLHPWHTITYLPWYSQSGSVDINTDPKDPPTQKSSDAWNFVGSRASMGASLVEFTESRLFIQNNPTLTITNKEDHSVVLSIPVIDYALLVKGYNQKDMTDQEYLDRQDVYNMTFFLDERGRWIDAVVIINDWRIIRHNVPVE